MAKKTKATKPGRPRATREKLKATTVMIPEDIIARVDAYTGSLVGAHNLSVTRSSAFRALIDEALKRRGF